VRTCRVSISNSEPEHFFRGDWLIKDTDINHSSIDTFPHTSWSVDNIFIYTKLHVKYFIVLYKLVIKAIKKYDR